MLCVYFRPHGFHVQVIVKICQPDHTLASVASKWCLFDQKMPVWELNQVDFK